ncbi:MAG: hypothetical protein HRU38_15110 [Saccharospirillaceae bacterium]|nr:hypothetical protein [Pseudomonadales bacterium]NRB79971.1 hypothetical protein [Saccharospirillaceae bacterium]
MIELILKITPLAWWIVIGFFILYYFLPISKQLNFHDDYVDKNLHIKKIGSDSQSKFSNEEYYLLCLDLIESWQWQIKMKLNIPFHVYGYSQINQYIIEQFKHDNKSWVNPLLDDLSLDERKKVEKLINNTHYQILKNTIKQDINDDSI